MKHNNRPRFGFIFYDLKFFRLGLGISKMRYVLRVGPFGFYYYPKLNGLRPTYSERIGKEYMIGTYTYLTEDYKRHWRFDARFGNRIWRHKIWR
jgi:hypothetical protein